MQLARAISPDQIASKYIISKSIKNELHPSETPKYSFSSISTSEYDSILSDHNLNDSNGMATQIEFRNTAYKSQYSKSTKSIDYFIELRDSS